MCRFRFALLAFALIAAACLPAPLAAETDLDRYIESERVKSERIIEELSRDNREHARQVQDEAARAIDRARQDLRLDDIERRQQQMQQDLDRLDRPPRNH